MAGKTRRTETTVSTQSTPEETLPGTAEVALHEDVTNVLLNFEIKKVCISV